METYLDLFEDCIRKQCDIIGTEAAYATARKAGLSVDPDGHIVSCIGNPIVVLLRLIRVFTNEGNLAALEQCTDLIDKFSEISDEFSPELNQSTEPQV